MILPLSVHPSRLTDLITWDRIRLDPPIPANTYHDGFGNFCHVIRAPAGRLTLSAEFLAQDRGEPDALAPQADGSTPWSELPDEACSFCSAAAIARPIACRIRLVAVRAAAGDGRGSRRSATSSTSASRSATNARARPRPRWTPLRSGAAYAATTRIWRSRCAAA